MLAHERCKYYADKFRYCGKNNLSIFQPVGRRAIGAVLHNSFVIALYADVACITITIREFLSCGVTRAYVSGVAK